MPPNVEAIIANPANAGLRRYLEPRHQRPALSAVASPNDVARPYDSLGTHPDLVARLWDELGKNLPADCRAIFYGTPSLMHPVTGIVFAFAGGTHDYAFRLPPGPRSQALQAGATRLKRYPLSPPLDLRQIGDEWVFGGWYRGEESWCLAAYEYAAGAV